MYRFWCCSSKITQWRDRRQLRHFATRKNPVGIQMLSKTLHKQLFGGNGEEEASVSVDSALLHKVKDHLQQHGLMNSKVKSNELPNVELKLPEMQGKNLAEHFFNITLRQASPYIKLADKLFEGEMPPIPKKWKCEPGWQRYSRDGAVVSVPYPDETVYVFDVETLVNGNYPVMATAVSNDCWYSWCSQRLVKDSFIYSLRPPTHTDLIPMESDIQSNPEDLDGIPRLVLGHNIGFDRSYMREQYFIKEPKMKFLDTMSMHIAICGFTSMQRILFMAKSKGRAVSKAVKEKQYLSQHYKDPSEFHWMQTGSMNNLNDVYQYHCDGEQLNKESRDIFVNGTIEDVSDSFQSLMTYCANDVKATLDVFKKLWPQFRAHFPSPVTLAGMLELGTAYLPVNNNWNRYIELSDQQFAANEDEICSSLATIAADVCSKCADNYQSDPWVFDLDWSTPDLKLLKQKRKVSESEKTPIDDSLHPVIKELLDSTRRLPKKESHMPGVPRWYSGFFPKISNGSGDHGPAGLTLLKRVSPKLLKLKWDGYPLYYHKKHGWGYVVPDKDDISAEELSMSVFDSSELLYPFREAREVTYNQPPHDQSIEGSRAFDGDFSSIIESSFERDSLSYEQSENIWNKIRVMNEHQKQLFFKKIHSSDGTRIPSWHTGLGPITDVKIPGGWFYKLPHKNGDKSNVGNPLSKDFLPQIGNGTLTSAAGSDAIKVLRLNIQGSYWKNNRDRIRSQMVTWLHHNHLPPHVTKEDNYNPNGLYGAILPRIITAGTVTRRAVEKTWLTASNAKLDRIGSELKSMVQSPPGYHFVGADVDSQELWIASLLGDAHFAGMHGSTAIGWMTLQGTKAEGTDVHSKTAELIGMSRDDAKIFNYGRIYGAGRMFAQKLLLQFNRKMTKEDARSKANKMYQATKGTKKRRGWNTTDSPYERSQWSGGSESSMFNALENTAVSPDPRTPVLRCKITKPLQPQYAHEEFMTSRINWVVQSSAVDYLHLMLVCMRWLFDEFDIDGRFCISIHDEVRYLVKSEDRYRAALALHITNLYTRALFAHKLGIDDLPQSVAFFSGVDLDKCLRKEPSMDCTTPSNLHGMQGSYHISPGETLDIYETLKATGGSLHKTQTGSQ